MADRNITHKVDPQYPLIAQVQGIQGNVVLQVVIGKQGNIIEMKVISGDKLLAEAATDAVKKWRYKPFLLNGQPVEVETLITVRFHM